MTILFLSLVSGTDLQVGWENSGVRKIQKRYVNHFSASSHVYLLLLSGIQSNFIVVSKTSACLQRSKDVSQVPLDRNHYNLNRFEGPEDPVWKMVVPEIQQRAGYASEFLSRRDQGEDIPSRVDCYFSDIEGTDLGFAVNWSLYHLTKTAHFVARESDLEKMEGLLQKQNGRRSVVVSGLGGMGKTQLAIKYAQLHQDEYSAVFFLDITSDKSMRKSYDVIAARITADHPTTNRLEVTPEKNEQNSNAVVSAVKKWLELPKNTSWLMVFDNYDNPAVPTNTHPERVDIQNYLPACNHGSVIVTTRVENVKLDSQSSMKIEKVSDLHGQEILAKTSGRQGVLKSKLLILNSSLRSKSNCANRQKYIQARDQTRWSSTSPGYCWLISPYLAYVIRKLSCLL